MSAGFRVLLVSTYDLGRQPFGLASPAAWLGRDGAEVECLDLSIEPFDEARIRAAGAVAFHVPMHTATRLAARFLPRVRAAAPDVPIACYGLYAAMNEAHLRSLGADAVIGGEFEAALAAWAAEARVRAGRGEQRPVASGTPLERLAFVVPDRSSLPALDRYARLDLGDGRLLIVGSTEASRGCRHRCRHCPIVPVYDGRFRVVPAEVVLEDVARQVAAGAEHMTFGDPDFLNGPGHALPLVRELHRRFPALGWDATIKVEHLVKHADALPELRDLGCRFVTTAVESVDDDVLRRLDKGHTRADFERVAERFRAIGLALHPTFVPFTPWTTPTGYLELLEAIGRLELVPSVSPVQLSIRLLVPAGSRLLDLDEVQRLVGPFDAERLVHPWAHPDPAVDALQREVEAIVAGADGVPREIAFDRVRDVAERAAGRVLGMARAGRAPKRPPVPFLTEPWYC